MLPLKSKRTVKVQKYCEYDSDEESISSNETIESVKLQASRKSAPTTIKKIVKKLDSVCKKSATSPILSSKQIKAVLTKESKVLKEKVTPTAKKKRDEKEKIKHVDLLTEQMPVCTPINKINKKKKEEETKKMEEEHKKKEEENTSLKRVQQQQAEPTKKLAAIKFSDDEESFLGFTKKSINCARALLDDVVDNKTNLMLKTHEAMKAQEINKKPDMKAVFGCVKEGLKISNSLDVKQEPKLKETRNQEQSQVGKSK